ncbi:flavin reductase family protein [Brucepastera parasyntrophica]|uniref:flavin reductase family protein n=1 Tax=Brucepastera parasyntrophica TaxID=2880008 RepID=UPI00210D275A|nr:flavin reductase family protein [Brucepastera parasyntrophica]ULQ58683.1 flavin reductase family protein [Brucepastera parasyntrophica]
MNTDFSGYDPVDLTEAYTLLTPGLPILVASKGMHYNLAPIAWNTPMDYEPVSKILFVSDPAHQTAKNIHETMEFAACIPSSANDPIIEQCGSVSSPESDKFEQFSIRSFPAADIDVRIPEVCSAWIECRVIRIIQEGSVEIFMGEATAAYKRKQENFQE